MTDAAVLRLFGANARLEERFTGDLAKRLYVSPSTVTRMAAPLEKLGIRRNRPQRHLHEGEGA